LNRNDKECKHLLDKPIDKFSAYSYSFEEQKYAGNNTKGGITYKSDYNTVRKPYGDNNMENETIFTVDRWYSYEELNGKQSINEIMSLIEKNQLKLSKLRNRPVVAYLTAVSTGALASEINISHDDVKKFMSIIADIPDVETEIDIILHSNGGYMKSAQRIVELLRDRFKVVNFLIPFAANSAAALMCMSADEIIMTPESALSPFDVQILSPDDETTYFPSRIMRESAKEAKRALNPFCIFMPYKLYKNWNWKMTKNIMLICDISEKESKNYPLYYLMKYMFKIKQLHNKDYSESFLLSFLKKFTTDGRKANRIVNLFINTGIKLSHDTPLMYGILKSTGLNVSKADGELLKLMRETWILGDVLFENSTIKKLYANSNKSFFSYITNEDKSKIPKKEK